MNVFNKIISLLEYYMGRRKCNLLKTLYLNFRCLPFKQAIHFPILCYGPMRIKLLAGKITLRDIRKGILKIGVDCAGYRTKGVTTLTLLPESNFEIEGNVIICQGASILLGRKAILTMKDNSTLGDDAEIICKRRISIGYMTDITWQCQVTDYGSHLVMDCETGWVSTIYREVEIGDYCWIGNRTTVQLGTRLPNRTIVASNSLLNKNYTAMGLQSYSLIGGQPAKLLKTGVMRIYDRQKESELSSYFSDWETNETTYVEINHPENQI